MENKALPLHLKYRPKSFDEFFGNESLIVSLKSIFLRKEGLPHSFLFAGPSGCGKTTLARIIKEKLSCHDGDFYEYNVANVRGIDTIREIIANSSYSPKGGECKIYLLDEAHKLTNDAQNALLKLLEDTPAHVYFVLCTTDPEKLLKTIRNRCTSFRVSSLPMPRLVTMIKDICLKEKAELFSEAYKAIADAADGSPRAALVILDSVIDIEDDEDLLNAIDKVSASSNNALDLCQALIKNMSWNKVAKIINQIEEEPEKIRYAILTYMSKALLNSENRRAYEILPYFLESYIYSGKAGLILSCYKSSKK